MNLLNDYVELIGAKNLISSYENLDNRQILLYYFQLQLKSIPQKKWKVQKSVGFTETVPSHLIPYVEKIEEKAKNADNLLPYCSCNVLNAKKEDKLLFDWKIHHLHLGHGSKKTKKSDFVNRANELLFLTFDEDTLYFITVMDHKSFSFYSLLEIVYNNWKFLLEPYKVNLAFRNTSSINTNVEIMSLREKNVNTMYTVKGNNYIAIGGGINGDGSSSVARMQAIRLSRGFKLAEKFFLKYCLENNIEINSYKIIYVSFTDIAIEINNLLILSIDLDTNIVLHINL